MNTSEILERFESVAMCFGLNAISNKHEKQVWIDAKNQILKTISQIKDELNLTEEADPYFDGDDDSIFEDGVISLTDHERVTYASYLDVIRRYAHDIDDYGYDLRSKLLDRFGLDNREFLSKTLSVEDLAIISNGWYDLPEDIQCKLLYSFD